MIDLPGADIQPHNAARWRVLIHDHGREAVLRAISGIVRRPALYADVRARLAPFGLPRSLGGPTSSPDGDSDPSAPADAPGSPQPGAAPGRATITTKPIEPQRNRTMPNAPHPLLARLHEARDQRGLSTVALCKAMAISSCTLHALKQGTAGPKVCAKIEAWLATPHEPVEHKPTAQVHRRPRAALDRAQPVAAAPILPTAMDLILAEACDLIAAAADVHHAGHHRAAIRLAHLAGARLAGISAA